MIAADVLARDLGAEPRKDARSREAELWVVATMAGNLPLANALFGSKQGGRIATALSDEGTLRHVIDEIEKNSSGYSEIAGKRMSGFDAPFPDWKVP